MLSTSSYTPKINALWTAFLLGLLFHTDLALMPLFHEMEIEHSHAGGDVNAIFGFMLLFFVLPMLAIVAPTFTVTKSYRVFHFYLTLVYSILNLGHLIADIVVGAPWYQLVLMTILVIIGLLLNLVSFQWLKKY